MKIIKFINKIKNGFFVAMKTSPSSLSIAQEITKIEQTKDAKEKYEASFTFLEKYSYLWGFRMYNRNLSWLNENIFWNLLNEFSDLKKQRPDRKFVLWSLANYAKTLDGDTAECGVLYGSSSFLICTVFKDKKGCIHHAFDSFEGLSKPSISDIPTSNNAFLWGKGDLSVSLEEAKKNLACFDFIEYHKGWIPEKFHEIEDSKFSFVHIDVDLYQPTKDAIEFFYLKMVKGGILLCDDYGYETCPGARKAFDEFIEKQIEKSVIHLTTGQGFIIKG